MFDKNIDGVTAVTILLDEPNGVKFSNNEDQEDGSNINHDDEDEDIALLYTKIEKIPIKDFSKEPRGLKDVDIFLNSTVLLLDVHENRVSVIIDLMLNSILKKQDEPTASIELAKNQLYVHEQVPKLARTMQGYYAYDSASESYHYDPSWICMMCSVPSLQKRHIAIARLHSPENFGNSMEEIQFIILVVAPAKEKGTKNALETCRTFATLFADVELKQKLLSAPNEADFKKVLYDGSRQLALELNIRDPRNRRLSHRNTELDEGLTSEKGTCGRKCSFGQGIVDDLRRRLKFYPSDFKDGFSGCRTIQKTVSTSIFLYFAILLPAIAFGMLNDSNTKGKLNVAKVIYSQTIGGLLFSFFSGQPMTIVLTTAPLAIYTKVIDELAKSWDVDFFALYSAVGLWNMFFLFLYAFFGFSKIMKWSTRSTEEIFALFISIAFIVDSTKDVVKDFGENYAKETCENGICDYKKDNSLLFLLLMLGTLWLGLTLFNFTKTPFLNAGKREILADYALPVSVLVMSFFGTYVFGDVKLKAFEFSGAEEIFKIADFTQLGPMHVFISLILGFCLSLLFFMDQNISSAMANAPSNKLKKGSAYHWDLIVIGLINGVLTVLGLPMIHGALPHSPLHVQALADHEEYIEHGHVYKRVIKSRETRVTSIIANALIGVSLFLLPVPLNYIPRAVLNGLFLYLSISALDSFQFFNRIMLLFTEQAAYPPNHYIRTVPQRKLHLFTVLQGIQLLVMCAFGFSPIPYMKMAFPILLLLLLPIRHKLVPMLIEKKYLKGIDHHI